MGWIGIDLDGTLAWHLKGDFPEIGPPIPRMVERVKALLKEGKDVRIFTSRASNPDQIPIVQKWLVTVAGLPCLQVTNAKDADTEAIWDDIAISVRKNEGVTDLECFLENFLQSHAYSETLSTPTRYIEKYLRPKFTPKKPLVH